ncbi:MAG: hypothetical protein PHW24_01575 [Candidatus Moranbacteria bacterium]|nr:hypothetical protein [Candidatus Moranbacteria bacterium]
MKKFSLMLVIMFVLVPLFSAFAEEVVDPNVPATPIYDAAKNPPSSAKNKKPYTPSTGVDNRTILNLVKENAKNHKKDMTDIADLAKKSIDERNASDKAIAESLKLNAKANGKVAETLESNKDAIQATWAEMKSTRDQLSGLGLVGLVVVVGVVVLLFFRSRRNTANAAQQVLEAIERPMNTWKVQAERLPEEIKEAIKPVADGMAAVVAANATTNVAIDKAKDAILEAIKSAKEEIPAATAGIAQMLKGFTLTGIHGKSYAIQPSFIDGKVRTLRVVNDLNVDDYDLSNGSKIPRNPARDLAHLKSTNANVLLAHFDPSMKSTDIQKSSIEAAIASGEIKEV